MPESQTCVYGCSFPAVRSWHISGVAAHCDRFAAPWQGYGIFIVLAAVFLAWNGYVYSKNA